jgi:uncharacterized YccA/Bax inhibitor family protein
MALFQSGNPTLSEKIFRKSAEAEHAGTMTVRGAIQKFGFLLFLVIAAASYTWHLYNQLQITLTMNLMWVGLIGGFIVGLIITFKPNTAKYLAPLYALLEGLMLGALSVTINQAFAASYPGIVLEAVGLTLGVALAMFLLYNFRIIQPTQKFKAIMLGSIMGIGVFYLVYFLLGMFGVNLPFMNWGDASWLGIGINLFVVAIAALSLILDFERIEVGEQTGAPKEMEWYGAFGLLVTLVWLYIQILKLLSRLSSRD